MSVSLGIEVNERADQDAERESQVVREHRGRGHVVVVARVWTVCLVTGSEERIVGAVVNYFALD
jgi:hypothetical protein